MGKKARIAAVVFSIIILAMITFAYFAFIRHFRSMTPLETTEITPGIWALKDKYVNAFILKAADDEYIAIDAGRSTMTLLTELKKVSVPPKQIRSVFLTHTDYDHAGGIEAFPNASVYIYEKEEAMINGSAHKSPFMKNSIPVPAISLKDGQTITRGSRQIRLYALPGHTTGHSAYIIDNKYIFTGDAIEISQNSLKVFIPAFNMDTGTCEKSLYRLTLLPDSLVVFTAHFGYAASLGNLKKTKNRIE